MQMKKHLLFEKRIRAKDGRRGETDREREGEGEREREGSSRFIYIQADFQLSKIRRNESTAGSARTNVRGEEGGERCVIRIHLCARMSCRSLPSCLLFLFRASDR